MALARLRDTWLQLPAAARERLAAVGAVPERPDVLCELTADGAGADGLAGQVMPGMDGDARLCLGILLGECLEAARDLAGLARRQGVAPTGKAATHRSMRADGLAQSQKAARLQTALALPERLPRGPTKARTRLAKASRATAEDGARAKRELEERERWVQRLAEILQREGLPRAVAAQDSLDPEGSLRRCAGASRARTLRAHVRHVERLREWMFAVHQRTWPGTPAQLGDYLEDLVAGGCRRTVPKSVVQAFSYVEEKGEVEPATRLAGTAYIRDLLADSEVRMAVGAPARVKAPGFFAAQIAALELLVVREAAPLSSGRRPGSSS